MTEESASPPAALLDLPSPAVLTTYRRNGTAASSPVWFRRVDDTLEVVIAEDALKARHLQRDPRCTLVVFEATAPFRGVRVETAATLRREGVGEARLPIASRYLGPDGGRQFAQSRGRGFVLAAPLTDARSWDLTPILP